MLFKKLRNEIVNLIRKCKKQYYENIARKLCETPPSSKNWWNAIRPFLVTSQRQIPPLFDADKGLYMITDSDKADLLNRYFVSQSNIDDSTHQLPINSVFSDQNKLENVLINQIEVLDTLKSLNTGKASGPDGINNRIWYELRYEIAEPLCNLFNYSLFTCTIPRSWKIANVSAVFKKGDTCNPSNYRPISLLCNVEKVFERIIFKHVFNFLKDTDFFTSYQSGFMPGDSTINQLTYLYDKFCNALDQGLEVRIIFFDISKAFDKVWHKGLIYKLEKSGVSGNLLRWFKNYLRDREQQVVIRGAKSRSLHISAGVPQGSILGPLLFLIFINDIVDNIECPINLFADDTSLYVLVNDPIDSARQLQNDIDRIDEWSDSWLVNFNPAKSETLLMTRKRIVIDHPDLLMSGVKINPVTSHKHLGVTFSSDGSWHSHIMNIKQKAWSRVNIMKCLKFRLDRKSLEMIYFAYVRPILEYADVIWDNCSQNDKNDLEKIQYEAARIVTGCTKLVSINSLLTEIGWQKLSDRRRNHKLIMFYKMVNQISPEYLQNLVPNYVGPYNLRNVNDIPRIPARTAQYFDSFLPSSVREWNSLNPEIRNADANEYYRHIKRNPVIGNQLFYYGPRSIQVIHTRLRTKCSNLREHLFRKNMIESPLCISCNVNETTDHYFFKCKMYNVARNKLRIAVSNLSIFTCNVLLNGDSRLSHVDNCKIFDAVFVYINESKRFKKYTVSN